MNENDIVKLKVAAYDKSQELGALSVRAQELQKEINDITVKIAEIENNVVPMVKRAPNSE